MNKLILTFLLFSSLNLIAQDDKIVTLEVTGQGKTLDEAKQNALRSAIEQAFGTFISSNTKLMNDEMVKDEIVSISNGNIRSFDILNETNLPDGSFSTFLRAQVSVNKLTSFCKSKGISVEFSGSLFAFNISLQELNKKSEIIAWSNIHKVISQLTKKSFSYKITAGNPVASDNSLWEIPLIINIKTNINYSAIAKLIYQFCQSVSLSNEEIITYKQLNKKTYALFINNRMGRFTFRNESTRNGIIGIPWEFLFASINNFNLNNGVSKFSIIDFIKYDYTKNSENRVSYDLFIKDNNPTLYTSDTRFPGQNVFETEGFFGRDRGVDVSSAQLTLYIYPEYNEIVIKSNYVDLIRSRVKFNSDSFLYEFDNLIPNRDAGGLYLRVMDYQDSPQEIQSINFHDWKMDISLIFSDRRTIEELKKISEYKIELNY